MERVDVRGTNRHMVTKNAREQERDSLGSPRVYSPFGDSSASTDGWNAHTLDTTSTPLSPVSVKKSVVSPDVLRTSLHHADWILLEALDPALAEENAKVHFSPKLTRPDSRDSHFRVNHGRERRRRNYLSEHNAHAGVLSSYSLNDVDLHMPKIQSTLSPGFTDLLSPVSQFTDGPMSPLDSSISSLQQTLHTANVSLARSVQQIREGTQTTSEKINAVTSSIELEDKGSNSSDDEDEWGTVMSSATRAAHSRLQRAYTSLSGAMYEFGQLDENQELFMIGALSLDTIKDDSKDDSRKKKEYTMEK